MKEGQPSTIHLRDYEAPAFTIEETTLHFDIHENYCDVTSTLSMKRHEGDDGSPMPHDEQMPHVRMTLSRGAWQFSLSVCMTPCF
ncbi:MAG: hypothetical protein AAF525_21885 [Pseudomonadota bacterium]